MLGSKNEKTYWFTVVKFWVVRNSAAALTEPQFN